MSNHSERVGLTSRGSNDPLLEENTTITQEAAVNELEDTSVSVASIANDDSFLEKLQQNLNKTSHVLALIAILLVIWWISLLGGLSWKQGQAKQVFNWHPLLMISCFCFMTVSALAFRFPYKSSDRNSTKLLHGVAWAVAALCAIVALVAVVKSHNDPVSGYIANLYSLHSWIGCGVILLYIGQFCVGAVSFGGGICNNIWIISPARKARILVFHRFLGSFIYNITAATILLGIQEKEGFVGCAYSVTEADTFPLVHIFKIPTPCQVSHALGIVVLLMALSTSFAIHNFGSSSAARQGVVTINRPAEETHRIV